MVLIGKRSLGLDLFPEKEAAKKFPLIHKLLHWDVCMKTVFTRVPLVAHSNST